MKKKKKTYSLVNFFNLQCQKFQNTQLSKLNKKKKNVFDL